MADTRVAFEASVESLLHGLRGSLTPALKARLLAVGLDVDKPPTGAVPATTWARWVDAAAAEIFSELPIDERHRRIGALALDGFKDTAIGKATMAILKLIGPRRSMHRLARNYRTVNNFCEPEVVELAPNQFRVTFRDAIGMPGYWAGTLQSAAEMIGAPEPKVSLVKHEPPVCVLEVIWRAA
ncbi:MAG: DUF2378 family protein [Deltaproteobacteria bacterium]|nr:DUF2378 family protein [Deltaproteobacteria bacterium]